MEKEEVPSTSRPVEKPIDDDVQDADVKQLKVQFMAKKVMQLQKSAQMDKEHDEKSSHHKQLKKVRSEEAEARVRQPLQRSRRSVSADVVSPLLLSEQSASQSVAKKSSEITTVNQVIHPEQSEKQESGSGITTVNQVIHPEPSEKQESVAEDPAGPAP